MNSPRILIIGANGQVGTELAAALAARHGEDAVVTSDIAGRDESFGLRHEILDVTDANALAAILAKQRITHVYQLAAALSATGEKQPVRAWDSTCGGF